MMLLLPHSLPLDPRRHAELKAMREAEAQRPGFQRLRARQYDELRRRLTGSQGLTVARAAVRSSAGLLDCCWVLLGAAACCYSCLPDGLSIPPDG